MRKLMLLMAMGLAPAVGLRAAEEASGEAEITKMSLGEHWDGTDFKPEDLKGRITLVAFWGFN